jgi:hypothetical protein
MPTIKPSFFAVLTLFTLAGGAAMASEDKYPAANFQPSVIFSNPELIAKSTSDGSGASADLTQTAHAAPDPKYPAAYFNPTVIYPSR